MLHQAVIDAINQVFDVGNDVKNSLRTSIQEVLLTNGQKLTELEKKRADLNRAIGELLDRSFKENDYTKYDSEFKRLSDELATVSQQITEEQERINECEASAAKVNEIIKDIESRDFKIEYYEDSLARDYIEQVIISGKNSITVKVRLNPNESVDVEIKG